MKTQLIALFLLITPVISMAFPGSTNSATVAFSNRPSISNPDWKWKVYTDEDSVFSVTISDVGAATSYYWQFRMASPTGIVFTADNTNITASGTSVTWSIFPTNMPPAGTYQSELKAYVSDTNGVRAVAGQGLLTIVKSLFE